MIKVMIYVPGRVVRIYEGDERTMHQGKWGTDPIKDVALRLNVASLIAEAMNLPVTRITLEV